MQGYFMKKLGFIIIVLGLNFLSNLAFSQNETSKTNLFEQSRQAFHSKGYCNNISHYFVFDNTYQSDQTLFFLTCRFFLINLPTSKFFN